MKLGRWQTLSKGRTLVTDVVNIARKMPLAPILREYDLLEIDRLRRKVRPKISWTPLFLKAYSIVSARRPELRQMYVPLPIPHIYNHPENVALVTITRKVDGEDRLYFARFHRPEEFSLIELQQRYEHFRRAPIKEIRQFRHQDAFSSLPWLCRAPIWWLMMSLWSAKRALNMGTFGMSISGLKSNVGVFHLGPATTVLGCDLIPRKGQNRCTLTFDHRILDGRPVAEILDDLHNAMAKEIADELKSLVNDSVNAQAIATAYTESEAA